VWLLESQVRFIWGVLFDSPEAMVLLMSAFMRVQFVVVRTSVVWTLLVLCR
jgi:hypothetical protein